MGEATEIEAHQLPEPLLVDDDALRREVTVHHLDVPVEEVEGLRQLEEAILDLNGVEVVLLGSWEGRGACEEERREERG